MYVAESKLKSTVLACLAASLLGCGSPHSDVKEGPVVLASFEAIIDGATHTVEFKPLVKPNKLTKNPPIPYKSRAYVGWPESVGYNGPAAYYFPARPFNCNGTNATYNTDARTLSVQVALRNILAAGVPECSDPSLSPIYCAANAGHPLNGYLNQNLYGPIELKMAYYYGDTDLSAVDGIINVGVYDQSVSPTTYVNKLYRTDLVNLNNDFGCGQSEISSGTCFLNDSGFSFTDDTTRPEYKSKVPGFDWASLLNTNDSSPEFALEPGEVSGCKTIQLFYGSSNPNLAPSFPNYVPQIHLYVDLIGFIENYGTLPARPTVTIPSSDGYSTSSTQTVTAAIVSPADRLRVFNGATETSCVDNNPACDSNLSAGTITMGVNLNAGQINRLYIHQGTSSVMSPAIMRNITYDNIAPTVGTFSPPNGATNVSVGINVIVTFSEPMDSSTINTSTLLVTAVGGNLCTSVSLSSDGYAATCTHTSNFVASTVHTVTVVGGVLGVKDVAGNTMSSIATSTFTTGSSDTIRPEVISTTPADNAADVPINIKPTVRFSEAMKSSTITATNLKLWAGSQNACPPTSLSQVTTSVGLSGDQITATLTPSSNLATNSEFTISVSTGAQDAAGNSMLGAFCSTFRTSSTSDTTSPSIVGSTPVSAATNVSETIRPEVFFSESMDASTLNTTNINLKVRDSQVTVPITTEVESDNLTVRIIPSSILSNNKAYILTVLSEVKDIAGNPMTAPWAIEFTTSTIPDTISPSVLLVDPAPDSADNSVAPIIKLRFTEPMNASTIHTGTLTLTSTGDGPGCSAGTISGTVSVSGDGLEATFNYPNVLCRRNTYTVTLSGGSSGAKDLAGNQLASTFTASFLTSKKNDGGPTVVTASPGNGTTGVGIDANVTIVFDQVIDGGTVDSSSVYISSGTCPTGGTAVSAALSVSADEKSVTIDPSSALSPDTTYRINVTTGVKDKSTPVVQAIAFCTTFRTGSGSDSARPFVSSTNPTDGATGWNRWESLSVTFSEAIDPRTVTPGNVEIIRTSDSSRVVVTYRFDMSGKVLTINPSKLLDSNENYYVNLKPSIRDTAGYALQSYTTFDFTTTNTSSDVTAPTVSNLRVYMSSGYGDVTCGVTNGVNRGTNDVGKEIKVYLSEPIDPDRAIAGVFALIDTPGASQSYVQLHTVTLTAADGGSQNGVARTMVTMRTDAQLSNGHTYQVKILTSVVDDANNSLASTYTCNFGT